jgi:dipeptidase D
VLADENLQHPALECLFTSDEETGLTGASELSRDLLTGSTLINLDSEDDGEIYVGCAGGIGTKALINYTPEELGEGYFGFKVEVSGLTGGHSGGDIHLGLGNAIKILGNYLWLLSKQMNVRLARFEGGNLHNAIPREASALVAVPYHEKETIRVLLNIYISEIENAFKNIEPGLKINLQSETITGKIITKKVSDKFINLLTACPHGVIAMSKDIPGLVETSTNLASVKMKENRLEVNTSQRSSSEQAKSELANQMYALFTLAGAEVIQSDGYPGWKPNLNSAILKKAAKSYLSLFGEDAKVKAIHAGLECGLFLEKYPNLDMISIGPQMYGVHSPDERLSISSTQKTWEWLVHVLSSKN